MSLYRQLAHAVTDWDIRQAKSKSYNRHALGIYLGRCEEIAAEVENGRDTREAILDGFTDRLRDYVLKSLGMPIATDADLQKYR